MATHADPAKAPAAKSGAKPVAKDDLQKLPLAEVEKRTRLIPRRPQRDRGEEVG